VEESSWGRGSEVSRAEPMVVFPEAETPMRMKMLGFMMIGVLQKNMIDLAVLTLHLFS
jgi:hypothetical protein